MVLLVLQVLLVYQAPPEQPALAGQEVPVGLEELAVSAEELFA